MTQPMLHPHGGPPALRMLLAGCLALAAPAPAAPPGTATPRIAVDQLGYLSTMDKVAVISDPQQGFNAAEHYQPGPSLEVRHWGTNAVALTAAPVPWNGGATHAQSGDKAWWLDFTALRRWGEYYLYDPANDARSDRFRIGHDTYDETLRHALRVFFYQRRGCAKQVPHADPRWADGASHLGPLQDANCRAVAAPGNAALERDLRGGWFDAGDYNKYVTFTVGPLRDLLLAFEHDPLLWGDDHGIPESGNGIPDLLDEVKWELDWLLRMQQPDGSVLSKVSVGGYQAASPPSADTAQAFYGAASTSATFAAAGSFALAAKAFTATGQDGYADTLRAAARAAWDWGAANPAVTFDNAGFASADPEVDDYGRAMLKLAAAVHLYALTGEAAFKAHVESNYLSAHPMQWWYWYAFESAVQDSLLCYAALPGVTAAVAAEIRARKQSSINGGEFLGAFTAATDAYRAHLKDQDHVWGSNVVKCRVGHLFQQQLVYRMDAPNAAACRAAAEGYLHYLHGVNPLALAFLTNLRAAGGDRCANEIYHGWFAHGTVWDNALTSPAGPPPGFLAGGPNPSWRPDPSYSGPRLAPPLDQPVLKAYRDWNTSWPENSWEITEPAIYYQAAYARLLAGTMAPLQFAEWAEGHGLAGPDAAPHADPDHDRLPNLLDFALGLSPVAADAPDAALPVSLAPHLVDGRQRLFLTATLPRRTGAGLVYQVEVSPDLAAWSVACTAAGDAPASGDGLVSETGTGRLRTLRVRDVADASATRRFIRLRVTMAE